VNQPFASGLFVLTGAPGTGKSAILDRLRAELRCEDEPAREVIAEQRASGGRGTWDQDPSLFVGLLLQRSIEKCEAARRSGEKTLFDRGIPDCVVYAIRAGADPEPSLTAVDAFRYEPNVLFLKPWSDIYTTDEERIMSLMTRYRSATRSEIATDGPVTCSSMSRGTRATRVAFVRQFVTRLA
jgi:predicted ATPase